MDTIGQILMVSIVAIVTAGLVLGSKKNTKEHFDFAGLTLTTPPSWYLPERYKPDQWVVRYYPDQISHPNCVYRDRGDPKVLNYNSSSYRFWRF